MYFKASEFERESYEENVLRLIEEIKDYSNVKIQMVQLVLAQTF